MAILPQLSAIYGDSWWKDKRYLSPLTAANCARLSSLSANMARPRLNTVAETNSSQFDDWEYSSVAEVTYGVS